MCCNFGIGFFAAIILLLRSFSFQGLLLSVLRESLKRNYALRFEPNIRIELSTLSPY